MKLAHITDASAKALNRTELPSLSKFHFLEDNVDLPLRKMHVLLLRSNKPVKRIRPNLVSTAEAWILEKQFHEFATLARPACLARVLWGHFIKFSGDNAVGH